MNPFGWAYTVSHKNDSWNSYINLTAQLKAFKVIIWLCKSILTLVHYLLSFIEHIIEIRILVILWNSEMKVAPTVQCYTEWAKYYSLHAYLTCWWLFYVVYLDPSIRESVAKFKMIWSFYKTQRTIGCWLALNIKGKL